MSRFLTPLLLLALVGCATTQPQPELAPEVQERVYYEGVFAVPGADLSRYRGLRLPPLILDDSQASVGPDLGVVTLPGQLSEDDRQYYRSHYTEAVFSHLVLDGTYRLSMDPGAAVLQLDSELIFLPPRRAASGDPREERPPLLLLNMEVYDSVSGEILLTITDSYPLGSNWTRASGSARSMQVRMAFEHWLGMLRQQLDALAGREES